MSPTHPQQIFQKHQTIFKTYPLNYVSKDRKNYRMDWARREFKNYKSGKSHIESQEKVRKVKGSMVTLGGLVQAYGGWEWPPALRGALKTAQKCSMLGEEFCNVDPSSGLTFYCLIDKEWEDTFRESWTMFTTNFDAGAKGNNT